MYVGHISAYSTEMLSAAAAAAIAAISERTLPSPLPYSKYCIGARNICHFVLGKIPVALETHEITVSKMYATMLADTRSTQPGRPSVGSISESCGVNRHTTRDALVPHQRSRSENW